MSYIIGTDFYYGTWAACRQPFYNNEYDTNVDPPQNPSGNLTANLHSRIYYDNYLEPVPPGYDPWPHTYFLTDDETMFRCIHWDIIGLTYNLTTIGMFWTFDGSVAGMFVYGLDNDDFDELLGGNWTNGSNTLVLDATARSVVGITPVGQTYTGAFIPGFTAIDKMMVMP